MNINFLKCHGSGNDFVLIDQLDFQVVKKCQEKEIAQAVSNRNGVIGSDGLLLVNKPTVENADAKMVVYTPDGSEVPMCVNGVRCVGRYILDKFPSLSAAKIETNSGIIAIKKEEKLLNMVDSYVVDKIEPILIKNISPRIYEKKDIVIDEYIPELSSVHKMSIVSTHTPHAVSIVDNIDENTLYKLGKKSDALLDIFPYGLNISFVKVIDNSNIYVRTYERNSIGLSLSCASAMISSAYVLCYLERLEYNKTVNIYNKGGLVTCTCNTSSAILSGNSTYVYEGDLDYNFESHELSKVLNGSFYFDETMKYSEFLSKTKTLCRESSFLAEFNATGD